MRVTPHQGRREGRLQGEAAQGETVLWGRARDVSILILRNVSAGEPHDTETVLCGSGRGRWSRASNGTSPAAYFINEVLIKTACHLGPKQATIEQSQAKNADSKVDSIHKRKLAKKGDTSRQNGINQKSPSRSRSHPSQLLANNEK